MDVVFRKATEDDIDKIMPLIKEAVEHMIRNNIYQWDSLYPQRDDIKKDVQNNHLTVGIYKGEIALIFALNDISDNEYSHGIWQYGDNYAVIHRLCVRPKFQNIGLAQEALKKACDMAKNLGKTSIRLDAFTQNPHALRLYQRSGYEMRGYANLRKGMFCLFEKKI